MTAVADASTLLAHDAREAVRELYDLLSRARPRRLLRHGVREGWRGRMTERVEAIKVRIDQALDIPAEGSTARLRASLQSLSQSLADTLAEVRAVEAREELALIWARCHAAVQPRYEAVTAVLREHSVFVPSLRPPNVSRTVFHVAAAMLGVLAVVSLPRSWPVTIGLALSASAWTAEFLRRRSPTLNRALMAFFRRVSHPHEWHHVNSSTWYVTALFILASVPHAPSVIVGLCVLGVGDPTASWFGRRFGRHRLLNGRSWEGSLAFWASGTTAAALTLEALFPALPLGQILFVSTSASAAGALVELLSRRIDDNFSVPLVACAVAWAISSIG